MIGLLSSPDEDIRNRAALHLAIRASDEGAAALGAVARDPLGSDAGRIAAAQSLAGMATRAAAEALLASLDTEPEAVRSAVVGAAEKAATRLAQGRIVTSPERSPGSSSPATRPPHARV